MPDEETAQRFAAKSEGRLEVFPCPLGHGWHVVYPAVELTANVR
jgi:hypothetical protein